MAQIPTWGEGKRQAISTASANFFQLAEDIEELENIHVIRVRGDRVRGAHWAGAFAPSSKQKGNLTPDLSVRSLHLFANAGKLSLQIASMH